DLLGDAVRRGDVDLDGEGELAGLSRKGCEDAPTYVNELAGGYAGCTEGYAVYLFVYGGRSGTWGCRGGVGAGRPRLRSWRLGFRTRLAFRLDLLPKLSCSLRGE